MAENAVNKRMAEMVTRIDWGSMRGEVDRFEQYLREVKQASENTVQSYRRDLMQMITYLEEKEIREAAKVTKTKQPIKTVERRRNNDSNCTGRR